MYHPRIAVQNDFIFEVLSPEEKEVFNRLYNHYYYQRHNQFWYQEAMKKLPILTQSTSMLVCGEDLGMVPDCVPWVMEQLQILSLEIQRMPKNPQHEFGHVWEYPYRSVCTILPMTWLHCAAGGKKTTNRLAAITTKCWDTGAKCPQPHRDGFAKRLCATIWNVRLCSVSVIPRLVIDGRGNPLPEM